MNPTTFTWSTTLVPRDGKFQVVWSNPGNIWPNTQRTDWHDTPEAAWADAAAKMGAAMIRSFHRRNRPARAAD